LKKTFLLQLLGVAANVSQMPLLERACGGGTILGLGEQLSEKIRFLMKSTDGSLLTK
jgi:hypothetical protein